MYKSAAAFSFTKATKVPKKNFLTSSYNKPDPGQYQKNILHTSNSGYHFTHSKKLPDPKPRAPGVGKYNIASTRTEGPKFSEYNHNKSTIFGDLVKKRKRDKTPGPGVYDSKMGTVKPRTVLGKFSQMKKDINYDNKKPGVGQYHPKTNREFGNGDKNKFTMPKSQRSNIVDVSKNSSSVKNKDDIKALAPGYYKLKSDFGTGGTKVLLRGKPTERKRPKTPGPDQYKHEEAKRKILKNAPSYGIGRGNKTSVIRKDNKNYPGPGKYNLKEEFDVSDVKRINARTFGKEGRMKDRRYKTPGPGQYKIPCSFGYTSPISGLENHYV